MGWSSPNECLEEQIPERSRCDCGGKSKRDIENEVEGVAVKRFQKSKTVFELVSLIALCRLHRPCVQKASDVLTIDRDKQPYKQGSDYMGSNPLMDGVYKGMHRSGVYPGRAIWDSTVVLHNRTHGTL